MRVLRAVLELRCVHHHLQRGAVTASVAPGRADLETLLSAVEFPAPYLVEKLVKDGVTDSAAEAEALFTEVKKYLVLTRLDRHISWQMYSLRVDEVWHQFVLYTGEYARFCERFFGEFVHHRPNNAPPAPSAGHEQPPTFHAFAVRYRDVFGHDLPEHWFDERSVTVNRRVINDKAGRLRTSRTQTRVCLIDDTGDIIFAVDALARQAVEFLARTAAFYVRELPGDLTDEERIGIVSTLVGQRLLRVAS